MIYSHSSNHLKRFPAVCCPGRVTGGIQDHSPGGVFPEEAHDPGFHAQFYGGRRLPWNPERPRKSRRTAPNIYQPEAAALVEGAVAVELPKLPFETGSLGGAVVSEALEFADNPEKLMEELHRVLAPKSKVVLHVRRRRRSLSGALRRWTGLVDPTREAKRDGFTPSELFETLKEGFDVEENVGYGRFFTECAEWLAELFAGLMPQTCEAGALDAERLRRAGKVYRAFKPVFALAKALDGLCFFLPTHHWAVRAKRRLLWAPRIAPRLRDGRTLADAVLGGKIGTAVGQ